jgi:von Willebrand factor A domain-containing protein 8
MAPELSEDMLLRLVAAFQDLRHLYDDGTLTYPYSLRGCYIILSISVIYSHNNVEIINIVKHISAYPSDTIDNALRNTFDFDMYRPDALEKLEEVLVHHRLIVPGSLDPQTARNATQKQSLDIDFEAGGSPPGAKEPKFGEEDPEGGSHEGGNQFSGGVCIVFLITFAYLLRYYLKQSGGSETAGQGGRGGYMRLSRGHEIHQLSDTQKVDVSEEVQEEARELARRELERRLKELDPSEADAEKYGHLLNAVQGHIAALHDLFESW